MSFSNLPSFIRFLESKQDLVRIRVEVDPRLEITEIATRIVKQNGPALLFERVKGSAFPVLINALGAERRVEWALGKPPSEIGEMVGRLARDGFPPSPRRLWRHRRLLKNVLAMRPRMSRSGPVFSHRIEPANLDRLPIAQSWPKDGGPFLTFPLVLTQSPNDGKLNMGIYRMQKYSSSLTGLHWQIGKGGGYHYRQAEDRNQALPVSVVVGADPILMLCGVLPLPEGLDEISFSGFLRGTSTSLTRRGSSAPPVPAEAEFVLEGEVPPFERREEGPYGDHFGHYSHPAPFPVFHVKRIWHRRGAVFPIAVVGRPPQEDQVLGNAVQELLLPLLKIMHPEVRDLWAYPEAGFHNLAVASVRPRYTKEGVKTALWILGEGQLSLTKCVILVDSNVDARDFPAVLRAVYDHFDPKTDFILIPGTPQDTLDFTGPKMNLGSKMILDATSKDRAPRRGRRVLEMGRLKKIDSRIVEARLFEGTLLAVHVTSDGREVLGKMIKSSFCPAVPLIAAVSADVPLDDLTLLLWGIFTRFDCARDTVFSHASLQGGHPAYEGSLLIDATWKNGYPEPLVMSQEIVERVNRRWAEYGLGPDPGRHSPEGALTRPKELLHSH